MMQSSNLRILADENISPRVVSFLRQNGWDVIDVKEENWHGVEDEILLEQAHSDQRFILTLDSDFGSLAINEERAFFGIIYLRLRNLGFSNCIRVLQKLIQLELELAQGMILVIDEARIRIRSS